MCGKYTHQHATKLQKEQLNLRFKVRTPPQEIEACHYGLVAQSNIGPTSVSKPSGEAVTSPSSGHGAYNRSGFFLHFMRNFEIKRRLISLSQHRCQC